MYLVGLNLGIITGERNIKEVLLFSQFSEGNTNVRLKVVPLEAELFGGPHGWSWTLEPVSSSTHAQPRAAPRERHLGRAHQVGQHPALQGRRKKNRGKAWTRVIRAIFSAARPGRWCRDSQRAAAPGPRCATPSARPEATSARRVRWHSSSSLVSEGVRRRKLRHAGQRASLQADGHDRSHE